ncbi:hypothetical protein [Salinispira pacifica]|uniref:Uncharacterized protein n=1 Tax=Salinispira pacifica TaxID=1307761 RepID=V5WCV6_9SPIO|nr:hypothetical protein [Salinispira pacifica]AHC13622.1 hypothetical protein L21SP2_0178 [Salinispira pacifica]
MKILRMKKKSGTPSQEDVLNILRNHGRVELERRMESEQALDGESPFRRHRSIGRSAVQRAGRAAMLLFALGVLGLGSAGVMRTMSVNQMVSSEMEVFVTEIVAPGERDGYFHGFEQEMSTLIDMVILPANEAP